MRHEIPPPGTLLPVTRAGTPVTGPQHTRPRMIASARSTCSHGAVVTAGRVCGILGTLLGPLPIALHLLLVVLGVPVDGRGR